MKESSAYPNVPNLKASWIKILPKDHMGIKPNYPVKRGQKLSFYIKIIRWIGCGSIGFGASPKMVAEINKNCGE
jgi:hypothetical protein